MTPVTGTVSWARPAQRPTGLPARRAGGVKAKGLRYERSLAKALPDAAHGQWFEFEDATGHHFCQPDLLHRTSRGVLILEVKLSWTPEARQQLDFLYIPVVSKALSVPVFGLVVCKNLRPRCSEKIFSSFSLASAAAVEGGAVVLHWLGASFLDIPPPPLWPAPVPVPPGEAGQTGRGLLEAPRPLLWSSAPFN